MARQDGKRRSKSQRIGEAGEALFRNWAIEHRLSANKVENDFGIDFFCHVFRTVPSGGEFLCGCVLASQVRSTSVKSGKQRVKLRRDDAHAALNADYPYVLIGVDLQSGRIHFGFLDDALVRKLHSFLGGTKGSLSWPLDRMESSDEKFFRKLDDVCKPGHQHRLRISRAKIEIAAAAPGSSISFFQTDLGGVAHIRMPLITKALDVAPADQADAARIVFEQAQVPADVRRFPPHSAIVKLSDLVNGSVLLEGAIERPLTLTAKAPNQKPVTITVGLRSIGDEIGWVLKTGLYMTLSAPRENGPEFVHQFNAGIAAKNTVPLWDAPAELEFLKCFCEGATIGRQDGAVFGIEHWPGLELVGTDLQRIEKVVHQYRIPTNGLQLAEIFSSPFQIGVSIAYAFMEGFELKDICPGFVFEEPLKGKNAEESLWRPCNFQVPIIMNLGLRGLVIWSEGVGSVYVVDNQICGFRPDHQHKWESDLRNETFQDLDSPELWFTKEWPGIPLGPETAFSGNFKGRTLPFAATISWPQEDERGPV